MDNFEMKLDFHEIFIDMKHIHVILQYIGTYYFIKEMHTACELIWPFLGNISQVSSGLWLWGGQTLGRRPFRSPIQVNTNTDGQMDSYRHIPTDRLMDR